MQSLNKLSLLVYSNSDCPLFSSGKEGLKGWRGHSGTGVMEGRRCMSCPNQKTSRMDDALQSYTGTCAEESGGSPQAPCIVSGRKPTDKSLRLAAVKQHVYFGSALQLQQPHAASANLSRRDLHATCEGSSWPSGFKQAVMYIYSEQQKTM